MHYEQTAVASGVEWFIPRRFLCERDVTLTIAIVVHGGAGNIPQTARADHAAGIRQATELGYAALAAGKTALDAVQAAVMCLEDLPAFNAGHGSCLTSAGTIEMDAGLMDGTGLRIGAVAALGQVSNPIAVCRLVLEHSDHILFAGQGAVDFAQKHGMPLVSPSALMTERRRAEFARLSQQTFADTLVHEQHASPGDTVGAVALDRFGNLAAACSTGGMTLKAPGRVGDSPLPGCGYYADSQYGGCATTGYGETIARSLLAYRAVDGLAHGLAPQMAAEAALDYLASHTQGWAGLVLLDRTGQVGAAFNALRMTHAWRREGEADITVVA